MSNHPPTTIWNEKHIKALLGLRRHPTHILQDAPWQSWLEARGGLKHVLETLPTLPLSTAQKQLLNLLLSHPDASTVFYAGKLHLGQSGYFARLSDLMQALAAHLNHWQLPVVLITTTPGNLPAPLTSLIGVENAIHTVAEIIQRPGVRLLTLMGPGGVGKTRLAIAAATQLREKFRDGAFFIPLETVTDPALLVSQIARTLNIETSGATSLSDALKAYLRARQMLLILDNFEQLIEAGSLVVELLQAAAALKIMVTSRESLAQYGEHRFIVPELLRPDPENLPPLEALEAWPAVSLFIQRVQALHPQFALNATNQDAIVRICDQLDGLPLAIELAAAQVKLLAPGQALPPLERGLKNLHSTLRDRPQRQKTLWDAIHWSYQLLPEDEKKLFRQLSVFGRTWRLEAARQICQIDDVPAGLEELTNKSLLRHASDSRFGMLQAVREYALDQLQSNAEAESVHRRHADYYLGFVLQAERALGGPEQSAWTAHIKQEHENLQIALQWLLDAQETEMAFTLLGAVWRFWDMLNIWSETRLWMDRTLTQGAALRSVGRAKTLWGASWLATHQSDYSKARALAEEGLALARENDEKLLTGQLLQNVADGFYRLCDHEQGMVYIEESLSILRALNNREEIAWALDHLARGQRERGEIVRSREVLQESLSIFRSLGHGWAIAYSLSHLGRLALEDGDNEIAEELLTESLALSQKIGGKQRISEILRELAVLAWRQGNLERARNMLNDALILSSQIGDRTGEGWGLNLLGRIALEQCDFATARQFFTKTQQLFNEVGEPAAIASNLNYLADLDKAER